MPALRGHHLICLHFFNGEGYNEEFIGNLKSTLSSASVDGVNVISGVDDICSKCPYKKETFCRHTDTSDKEIRDMDSTALKLLDLSPGDLVNWEEIRRVLPSIFHEWHRNYCSACDWKAACEGNGLFKKMSSLE